MLLGSTTYLITTVLDDCLILFLFWTWMASRLTILMIIIALRCYLIQFLFITASLRDSAGWHILTSASHLLLG